MKAQLIKTDGTVTDIVPKDGTEFFSLEELQGYVGGNIDLQYLPNSEEMIVVNDEGKVRGMDVNDVATAIWKKAYPIAEYPVNNDELIVGDVVVCDRKMVK